MALAVYKSPMARGTRVLGRGGVSTGFLTGGSRRCQLEGCTGRRLCVSWPPFHNKTWPCTKGMAFDETNGWRIE